LSYPYNPDANPATSSDARVPYYGDWVWAVGFNDGTVYGGKLSLSAKGNADTGLLNASFGAGVTCSGSLSTCVNTGVGQGVMGSVVLDNGTSQLASAFRVGSGVNQTGFLALDDDGKITVDPELKQPLFEGSGFWFFSSSSSNRASVVVLIAQQDADPEIKANSSETVGSAFSAQATPSLKSLATPGNSLARRAVLERMKSLLERH